jgi:hypothetical protein
MSETGNLSQETKEHPAVIGTADVVIGLPALQNSDDLRWASELAGIGQRVLIAYPDTIPRLDSQQLAGPEFLPYEATTGDRYLNSPLFGSFQEVFQIAQRVGAKCCLVWNTNPEKLSIEMIERMVMPALTQGCDLVIPRYIEMKLGTLVNSSIVYPIVRALYGKRISFPMTIDLSFSGQFVDRLLQTDAKTHRPRCQQWITSEAICTGVNIGQAYLPMEPPRAPESVDVSTILSLVLGRLFQDLERNMTFWQRVTSSLAVPTFGEQNPSQEAEEVTVDVHPMIETFQLGYKNLREIWNVALPPATLLDLKRLTVLDTAAFRMPDELWVRIVYDFALAHRQRAINREHLLRAMTPLYLAWVASHALELKEAPQSGFQSSLERLAVAYEKQKPYLLSRWRWPDRFNP